jgi:hypothetical protein
VLLHPAGQRRGPFPCAGQAVVERGDLLVDAEDGPQRGPVVDDDPRRQPVDADQAPADGGLHHPDAAGHA